MSRAIDHRPHHSHQSWEQPLRALIDAPGGAGDGHRRWRSSWRLHASGVADRATPRLMARLMREGARGGWVNGSLTWSGLDSWHVKSGEYRADHLALIRELYAVHRAREGRTELLHATAPTRRSISAAATARSCGRCWRRRTASA